MIDAHFDNPFTTAIAAGMVACIRGSRMIGWLPRVANRPTSFEAILIDCGVSR